MLAILQASTSHTPEQDACLAGDAPDEVISCGIEAVSVTAVALPGPTLLTMGLPRPCLHYSSFHHPSAAQFNSTRRIATCCCKFCCPCNVFFPVCELVRVHRGCASGTTQALHFCILEGQSTRWASVGRFDVGFCYYAFWAQAGTGAADASEQECLAADLRQAKPSCSKRALLHYTGGHWGAALLP